MYTSHNRVPANTFTIHSPFLRLAGPCATSTHHCHSMHSTGTHNASISLRTCLVMAMPLVWWKPEDTLVVGDVLDKMGHVLQPIREVHVHQMYKTMEQFLPLVPPGANFSMSVSGFREQDKMSGDWFFYAIKFEHLESWTFCLTLWSKIISRQL